VLSPLCHAFQATFQAGVHLEDVGREFEEEIGRRFGKEGYGKEEEMETLIRKLLEKRFPLD
jgi:hypothetical protein